MSGGNAPSVTPGSTKRIRTVVFVFVVVVLAGASCAQTPASVKGPTNGSAPLTISVDAGSSGTWVVAPDRGFWELLRLGRDERDWSLETPRGMADNGGLLITADGGGTLLAGFRPSQQIGFSPLAVTAEAGRSWQPGLLPGGLARTPDGLASDGETTWALLESDGGEVVRSSGSRYAWSKMTDSALVAASPGTRSCGVRSLTALVSLSPSAPMLGARCSRPGIVGIVDETSGSWVLDGPTLPERGESVVDVVRLTRASDGVLAVLLMGRRGSRTVFAAWTRSGRARWRVSGAFPLPSGEEVLSAGPRPGGGCYLLTRAGTTVHVVEAAGTSGAAWRSLPDPPRGTSAVAFPTATRADAFTAEAGSMVDWRLVGTAWERAQTIRIPL